MAEGQVGKPGMAHRRNTLRSSYMKFYQIRSRGCGEIASDGRKDGQTKRRLYALPSGSIKMGHFLNSIHLRDSERFRLTGTAAYDLGTPAVHQRQFRDYARHSLH